MSGGVKFIPIAKETLDGDPFRFVRPVALADEDRARLERIRVLSSRCECPTCEERRFLLRVIAELERKA